MPPPQQGIAKRPALGRVDDEIERFAGLEKGLFEERVVVGDHGQEVSGDLRQKIVNRAAKIRPIELPQAFPQARPPGDVGGVRRDFREIVPILVVV
jgi:hypothetical protein